MVNEMPLAWLDTPEGRQLLSGPDAQLVFMVRCSECGGVNESTSRRCQTCMNSGTPGFIAMRVPLLLIVEHLMFLAADVVTTTERRAQGETFSSPIAPPIAVQMNTALGIERRDGAVLSNLYSQAVNKRRCPDCWGPIIDVTRPKMQGQRWSCTDAYCGSEFATLFLGEADFVAMRVGEASPKRANRIPIPMQPKGENYGR